MNNLCIFEGAKRMRLGEFVCVGEEQRMYGKVFFWERERLGVCWVTAGS